MGMYDTLNGEQVKCFPVAFLYHDEVAFSGGSLDYYNNGDPVPYKRYHYNYGKDFTVFHVVGKDRQSFFGYQFIVHVIRNGTLVASKEDVLNDEDFRCPFVIDHYGNPLNIPSKEDAERFIKEETDKNQRIDELNSEWLRLFNEQPPINSKQVLGNAALKRIDETIRSICWDHEQKWYLTSCRDDCVRFGEWLSVFEHDKDDAPCYSLITENIKSSLKKDPSLLERYLRWYEADPVEEATIRKLIEEATTDH